MTRGKRIRKATGWRWLTALGMLLSLVAGIIVSDHAKAETIEKSTTAQNMLARYSRDLTRDAEQGRFNSLTDRSDEVTRAIQILSRAQKSNPVVLTDSQAIRDLVAARVAQRIATGDVPESLQGKRLLKLNLDLLFKDSENGAELVSALSAILSEAAQSEARIILLIDPIQSLVGNNAAFNGAASALLREAIKNGDLQCLGASTDITFQQSVASDETLAPLFAAVELQEVTDARAQQSDDDAKSARTENSSAEDF